MDTYVAVSNLEWEKEITGGPYNLDDPSQVTPQEGNHLMLESEALAGGWYYTIGGANLVPAPGQPADPDAPDEQGEKDEQGDEGGKDEQGGKGGKGGKGKK